MRGRLCLCRIICSITHLLLFLVSYCSGAWARRNERTNPFPCNSSAQSLCCSCSHAQLKTDAMLSTGSRSLSVMDQPSKCWLCSTGAVGCFDGFFGGLDRHLPLKSPVLRVREPSGFLLSLSPHLRLSAPVMALRGGPAREPLKTVPSIFWAHCPMPLRTSLITDWQQQGVPSLS